MLAVQLPVQEIKLYGIHTYIHIVNSQPNSFAVKLAENMDLYKSVFSQCNTVSLTHLGPNGYTTIYTD